MNTTAFCRLRKEAYALRPIWVVTLIAMLPAGLLQHEGRVFLAIVWLGYFGGSMFLSAASFGLEFDHKTMGLLLSQPVPRRRLWWEKMAVLATALGSILLLLILVLMLDRVTRQLQFGQAPLTQSSRESLHTMWRWALLPATIGFCTGPLWTLLARGTFGGVALTFLGPWIPLAVLALFAPHNEIPINKILGIYCLALFLTGYRHFQKLEDASMLTGQLESPSSSFWPGSFERLEHRLSHRCTGTLSNLVKKELRMQQPTFMVAGLVVIICLITVGTDLLQPAQGSQIPVMMPWLFSLLIPTIAGAISVAEERELGLLGWHLTLPVPARRQYLVKLLVVFAVNVLLGLLLPAVLAQLAAWKFGGEHELTDHLRDFTVLNLHMLWTAILVSSLSTSCLRALVGTIGLFTAAFCLALAVGPLLNRLMASLIFGHGLPPQAVATAVAAAWVVLLLTLLIATFEIGLANYRVIPGSVWSAIRSVALIAAVACFIQLSLVAFHFLGRAFRIGSSP